METQCESLELATILRDNGIKVSIEMNNRRIKKSFEFANKNNIRYVIVVGSDEIKQNKYSIKDMETGNQKLLNTEEIINFILNNKE